MQRNSIIVLFLTLLFFVSCSSSNSSNDSDIIPDDDADGSDAENIDSGYEMLLQGRGHLSV